MSEDDDCLSKRKNPSRIGLLHAANAGGKGQSISGVFDRVRALPRRVELGQNQLLAYWPSLALSMLVAIPGHRRRTLARN